MTWIYMKEILVVDAFPIDFCNKFDILNRDFCIKKYDASLWCFIFKLDGLVFCSSCSKSLWAALQYQSRWKIYHQWTITGLMKVLEGKGIYVSSQSNPWKYLQRVVCILYPWHSLLYIWRYICDIWLYWQGLSKESKFLHLPCYLFYIYI